MKVINTTIYNTQDIVNLIEYVGSVTKPKLNNKEPDRYAKNVADIAVLHISYSYGPYPGTSRSYEQDQPFELRVKLPRFSRLHNENPLVALARAVDAVDIVEDDYYTYSLTTQLVEKIAIEIKHELRRITLDGAKFVVPSNFNIRYAKRLTKKKNNEAKAAKLSVFLDKALLERSELDKKIEEYQKTIKELENKVWK